MADRQKKLAVAAAVAADLLAAADVVGVLLVGSMARGIDGVDSDIDLAALGRLSRAQDARLLRLSGAEVGIEFFDLGTIERWQEEILLPPHELRDLGRLSNGVLLAGDVGLPIVLAAANERATLAPPYASQLFAAAQANLETATTKIRRGIAASSRVLWCLQACVAALAELTLYRTPQRYQKPKWVRHDLEHAPNHELCSMIHDLFYQSFVGEPSELLTQLERLRAAAFSGCASIGLDPTRRLNAEPYRLGYLKRTFKDAFSLARSGDEDGAAFTGIIAARLAVSFVRSLSPGASRAVERMVLQVIRQRRSSLARQALQLGRVLAHLASLYDLEYARYGANQFNKV